MVKTTPERTLQLLQKAVEERGEDYVYPDEWKTSTSVDLQPTLCMYVKPDGSGPACIAGYIMHEYGASLEFLGKVEGSTVTSPAEELGIDPMSRTLLFDAQCAQDEGQTWGAALVQARSRYESEMF